MGEISSQFAAPVAPPSGPSGPTWLELARQARKQDPPVDWNSIACRVFAAGLRTIEGRQVKDAVEKLGLG